MCCTHVGHSYTFGFMVAIAASANLLGRYYPPTHYPTFGSFGNGEREREKKKTWCDSQDESRLTNSVYNNISIQRIGHIVSCFASPDGISAEAQRKGTCEDHAIRARFDVVAHGRMRENFL